ncbi:MAG: DUF1552 domain-containing protein [Planctomycetaceae bacterium]|nr:DUF1552 domain-containing protein [Planctomycetaceae bacterium]
MKMIPRRTVLKGAGVALGLPFLEAMTPSGFGMTPASKPPRRIGWVYIPNGVVEEDWTPHGEGRDFKLNTSNCCLEDIRNDLLFVSNLCHDKARSNGDGGGAHSREGATFLTAVQAKKTGGKDIYLGQSIDQLIAGKIGHQTRLPSMELGIEPTRKEGRCDSGYSCIYLSNISWRSPTQPSGVEINPRRAFDRLFGVSGSDAKEFQQRSADRQSVLDYVADNATQLRKQLGATDRRKLDEYFDSVREVERQIDHVAGLPPLGVSQDLRPPTEPHDFMHHIRLMYDLVVLSWQTDATRIITFMTGNAQTDRVYENLGLNSGHHQLTHAKEKREQIRLIDAFLAEEFGHFVRRLGSVPEGEGRLLDNCMVLYGSAMGDGRRHNHEHLPCIVAGRGGGAIDTGRHLVMPEETPMANLFVSMANQMGVAIDHFGDSNEMLKDVGPSV